MELSIFIEARLGPEGIRDLDLFLATAEMELVPLDTDQTRLARSAISAPWKPSSGGTKKDQSYSPQRLTISRGLTIFYIPEEHSALIVRVLHTRMDAKPHFAESGEHRT